MSYWCITCICLSLLLSGCSTEFNPATQRQETLMYSDEKEEDIGASVALQVEKSMVVNTEVDINARLEKILKRIVAVCERKDLIYTIRVIDEDEVNAFSLPGGYIYIHKGLIERIDNDDQLASVVAHEVAHVTAKHSMKRLQGAYGATILTGVAIISGQGAMAAGVNLAAATIIFQNSREDEFEADRLGVRYMRRAGYDTSQMRVMLGKLLDYQNKQPLRPLNYWRSHPYIPQRMAQADMQSTGRADFKSYLNVTGEEK